MFFAGIDEAGRGSLLGPLVMAVVYLPESGISELLNIGVRDSKVLSFKERGLLQAKIKQLARRKNGLVTLKIISPRQIDRFRQAHGQGGLNELERRTARQLLRALLSHCPPGPEKLTIILDGKKIFENLSHPFPQLPLAQIRAEDRADQKFPIVAAASIVAKHQRDLCLRKICLRYAPEFGEIRGNGYPNAGTKKFIRDYQRRYGCYPPEARKTWKTLSQPKTSQGWLPFLENNP